VRMKVRGVGRSTNAPRIPNPEIRANSRLLVLCAFVVAGCMLFWGCGGSSSESLKSESATDASLANVPFQGNGTPAEGGVLKFARGLQPSSLNPWTEPSTANNPVETQIYDGLVEASPDPNKITPGLAESWEISPDHLVYTFTLRPNVKFSNGQPLRATDVKFSLENAASPKINPVGYKLLSVIEKIDIPDPTHVRVTLNRVSPAFLANLTTTIALIVPESVFERLGPEEFGFNPVGTGPFMVTQFSAGNPEIVLKRNPFYWKHGLPYLDGIIYKYIANDNARMLAVQSGSVDIAESVPFSQIDQVGNAPGVAVVKQHTFASDWIFINGCKPPLDEIAVRQALVYATPLKEISDTVFRGLAPVAATASLPTKYLDTSIKPYPYDPGKARELLEKSKAQDLSFELLITSGDSVGAQVATILQASWAKVGIKLSIRQTDFISMFGDLEGGNYDLANWTPTSIVSDVPVDDEFDEFVANSSEPKIFPWGCWDSPRASELVDRATTTWSEEKRRRYFSEYQRVLRREQPILNLVHLPNLFAVRAEVHNFVAVGAVWPLMGETWLDR
jgi:peptide/nickel transport system substrate-binding protein